MRVPFRRRSAAARHGSGTALRWLLGRFRAGIAAGVLIALLSLSMTGWAASSSPGALPPAPPAANTLPQFASVERRPLAETFVTRGAVGSVGAVEVHVTAAGDTIPIVTGIVSAGEPVTHGDTVLEVSGRPVLALVGSVPAYRDLRPGMTGADVEQLQNGLVAGGFGPVEDPVGKYGASTAAAVSLLYERAGFEAPAPSPASDTELEAAKAAVDAAETAIEGLGADPVANLEAELAVAGAQRQLDSARADGDQAVALAEDALHRARAEHQAAPGPASERAVVEAEASVQSAIRARGDSVAAAEDAIRLARARANALHSANPARASAAEELRAAQLRLLAAAEDAQTPLPRQEIVYVPTLPTQVVDVAGRLGEPPDADRPAVTLADGRVGVSISVPPAVGRMLVGGVEATVVDDRDGRELSAVVVDNGEQSPGEDGTVEAFLAFNSDVDPRNVSRDVRVAVELSASDGPVLAVPFTSVRSTAAGATFVEISVGSELERVSVRIGQVADGWVEVVDSEPAIEEGMEVRVGAERQ